MKKRRHLETKIVRLSRYSKVILLTGARQVGKSTLYGMLFPEVPRVLFEPDKDVLGARQDPDLFLQDNPAPLILDEIQCVPTLLSSIKVAVDRSDRCPQYFMTGSQNLAMLKTAVETMAGRVSIIGLYPMTLYEQLDVAGDRNWLEVYLTDPSNFKVQVAGLYETASVLQIMWRGGMPGYLETPDDLLHNQFESYVRTYIQRDVLMVAPLQDVEEFTSFLGVAAALTGQEINHSQLGREIHVAGPTARKWIALLKQSYQWREIPAYDGNVLKRLSQKPKGYITDTGIACYLQRISSPEALRDNPLRGRLFETMIANTIETILSALPFSTQLYHWRTTSGNAEIDLIVSFDNKLYPIEIKMQSRLNAYDARSMKAFRETYQGKNGVTVMPGLIIYTGTECYRLTPDVIVVPWNVKMHQSI
jgi:predicted AAA+ superfamily ATPase